MASLRGWRFAAFGLAAVVLGSLTTSVTAPAYFDSGGTRTASSNDDAFAFVITLADYQQPALDFILPMVREDRVANEPQAFRPMAIKERASRSAVRPTALSGWRSGRLRKLAA